MWGLCRRRGPGVPQALTRRDWQLVGSTARCPGLARRVSVERTGTPTPASKLSVTPESGPSSCRTGVFCG